MNEEGENPVELYRMIINSKDPVLKKRGLKYSIQGFKDKITKEPDAADKLANYMVDNGLIKDHETFYSLAYPKKVVPQTVVEPVGVKPNETNVVPSIGREVQKQALEPQPAEPVKPEPSLWEKAKSYVNDLGISINRGIAQGKAIQTTKPTDLATGNTGGIDFAAMAKANKEVKDVGQTATEQDTLPSPAPAAAPTPTSSPNRMEYGMILQTMQKWHCP